MSEFEITNFIQGLDTRRMSISAPVGTLSKLENAHINRGAEIEKRKAFVEKYDLSGTVGLAEIKGTIWVFGSQDRPASLNTSISYQKLEHPSGANLSRIMDWTTFGGELYVSALFDDGSIHHFYNGVIVEFWKDFSGVSQISSNEQVATYLAGIIDPEDAYISSSSLNTVRVEASVSGTEFTYSADVLGGSGQVITPSVIQANDPGQSEALASGSIDITGGSTGSIDSITVDGLEILGSPVAFNSDTETTANDVATQIELYSNYTASVISSNIIITSPVGTGSSSNGDVIVVNITGDITVSAVNFAGGQDYVGPTQQIVDFTISGSYEEGIVYQIILDSKAYSKFGNLPARGIAIQTHKNKIYTTVQDYIYFSALANAEVWDPDDNTYPGAGFVRLVDFSGESESLSGIASYGNYLSVFGYSTITLMQVDPDPENNQVVQIIEGTGTRYPGSIQSYGSQDVLYLDESGIRSVKARQYTDTPGVTDVGSAIDDIVISNLKDITQDQINNIQSIIDPESGRYWICIGDTAYVLSAFPSAKIVAWSTYKMPFDTTDLVVSNRRVWVRADDKLYLYGGDDNNTYDSSKVVVELSYIDFGAPTISKTLTSFDAALEGEWDVSLLLDPRKPSLKHRVGKITETTYLSPNNSLNLKATHIAPVLISEFDGPAKISKISINVKTR